MPRQKRNDRIAEADLDTRVSRRAIASSPYDDERGEPYVRADIAALVAIVNLQRAASGGCRATISKGVMPSSWTGQSPRRVAGALRRPQWRPTSPRPREERMKTFDCW